MLSLSASNGVVLATEKKQKSILYDEQSVHKVEPITKHIGMVYSGMGPDYRWGERIRVSVALGENGLYFVLQPLDVIVFQAISAY